MKLVPKATVVLLGCSNGRVQNATNVEQHRRLVKLLTQKYSLTVIEYETIWQDAMTGMTYSAKRRAQCLQEAIENPNVRAIFDLTGGDLANQVLDFLPLDPLKKLTRPPLYYVGYSDNSVLLNALLALDYCVPVNFWLPSIEQDDETRNYFEQSFLAGDWIAYSEQAIGGNLRCFLKLAGTPYFPPKTTHQTLLLETSSGSLDRIGSLLTQAKQIGVLDQVERIVLGQFNEIDQKGQRDQLKNYLMSLTSTPITECCQLGHQLPLRPIAYRKLTAQID